MRTRDALLVEVALTRGTARCLSLLAVEVIGLGDGLAPHRRAGQGQRGECQRSGHKEFESVRFHRAALLKNQ